MVNTARLLTSNERFKYGLRLREYEILKTLQCENEVTTTIEPFYCESCLVVQALELSEGEIKKISQQVTHLKLLRRRRPCTTTFAPS